MMWLLFAVLSMFAYAGAELLGKKIVDTGHETIPLEMLVSVLVLSFFTGMIL